MTTFEDRERAFENKFAHDEALRFRVHMRAVQLLGQWAAKRLGKTPESGAAYVQSLMEGHVEVPGNRPLLARIEADFQVAGLAISLHRIQRQMDDSETLARQQLAETGA